MIDRLPTAVICLQDLTRAVCRLEVIPVEDPATVRTSPIPTECATPKDPVGDRPLVSSTYTSVTTIRLPEFLPPEG